MSPGGEWRLSRCCSSVGAQKEHKFGKENDVPTVKHGTFEKALEGKSQKRRKSRTELPVTPAFSGGQRRGYERTSRNPLCLLNIQLSSLIPDTKQGIVWELVEFKEQSYTYVSSVL